MIFLIPFLLCCVEPLSSEFTSTLHIISPLSSKPLELRDGQEIIYHRRQSFSLLASSDSSDWSVCYFTRPNGTVCRLLHFDYDIPGCPEVSRDEGGSPTCRYDVNRPTEGNWTNSLFVFNETSGDFDVKSVSLRALVKSRLRTSTKTIKLHLDDSMELSCTAERGYPASSISWRSSYSLLSPFPASVECDDFSCSTSSTLNFTARRVGKNNVLCISTQKDTLGNIIKNTLNIGVMVLPAPESSSGLRSAWSIFSLIMVLFLLLFLVLLLVYLFLLCKVRKRKKAESQEIVVHDSHPFTIYNPPSVSSSSAYFSSGSVETGLPPSSELQELKVQPSSDNDFLTDDDGLFKFEWEGWGPASECGSLSDIVESSSSSEDSSFLEKEPVQTLDKSTQAIYGALPNESWV